MHSKCDTIRSTKSLKPLALFLEPEPGLCASAAPYGAQNVENADVFLDLKVVHYGGKGLNPSSSTTSAVPTTCSSPRTFETAWLKQPPQPAVSNFQGKCLARTIYTPKSSRGGGGSEVAPAADTEFASGSTFASLESFDAASGYIFTDPDTQVWCFPSSLYQYRPLLQCLRAVSLFLSAVYRIVQVSVFLRCADQDGYSFASKLCG